MLSGWLKLSLLIYWTSLTCGSIDPNLTCWSANLLIYWASSICWITYLSIIQVFENPRVFEIEDLKARAEYVMRWCHRLRRGGLFCWGTLLEKVLTLAPFPFVYKVLTKESDVSDLIYKGFRRITFDKPFEACILADENKFHLQFQIKQQIFLFEVTC